MSRKHFVLLAAALRVARENHPAESTDDLIRTVATVCNQCNPLFSFDRFYQAANYKGLNDANN